MSPDKDLGHGAGESVPLSGKENFQGRPHPSTYVLMDGMGNPWGPFDSALKAAEWAQTKWSGVGESIGDEHGHFSEGWTVVSLRHPET